jgi:hypothetical protein
MHLKEKKEVVERVMSMRSEVVFKRDASEKKLIERPWMGIGRRSLN